MAQFIAVTNEDGMRLYIAVSGIKIVAEKENGKAFLETYVDKRFSSIGINCRESFDEVVAAINK